MSFHNVLHKKLRPTDCVWRSNCSCRCIIIVCLSMSKSRGHRRAGAIMHTVIQQLGSEFEFLKNVIALASAIPSNSLECDDLNATLVDVLRDRFSCVCYQAMETTASTDGDLVVKAKIVLNWVNSDGDWVHAFAAFLSRDVLRMAKPASPAGEPPRTAPSDSS